MYINSFCSISTAGILNPQSHTKDILPLTMPKAVCPEPEYKDLIPPMQLRRMSKPARLGVAAAKLCIQSYNQFMPTSIHVGTAYGMLDDSENFLKRILDQEEQMLNPTAFIQSTHNTVSGQIALSIGCTAHNMTYVHSGHSFESALLDAALFLENVPKNENILVGSIEECTDTSYAILKRFGVYNEDNIAGEGAHFICLSNEKQTGSLAQLKAFGMFKATDKIILAAEIEDFVNIHKNDTVTNDLFLHGLAEAPDVPLFSNAIPYQPFSGKYATMAAFGLIYGCMKLLESEAENCWVLNGFGAYYSILLLSKP
jgi:3-oxoacyl-[acyl-carrier-protein] synthase II